MCSDLPLQQLKLVASGICIILHLHYIIITCQSHAGVYAHSQVFLPVCVQQGRHALPLTFAKGKLSFVESVNLPILEVYKRDGAGACVYLYTLNLHTYTGSVMSVHTHFLAGTNELVM